MRRLLIARCTIVALTTLSCSKSLAITFKAEVLLPSREVKTYVLREGKAIRIDTGLKNIECAAAVTPPMEHIEEGQKMKIQVASVECNEKKRATRFSTSIYCGHRITSERGRATARDKDTGNQIFITLSCI